jgi:hypothetical protein
VTRRASLSDGPWLRAASISMLFLREVPARVGGRWAQSDDGGDAAAQCRRLVEAGDRTRRSESGAP